MPWAAQLAVRKPLFEGAERRVISPASCSINKYVPRAYSGGKQKTEPGYQGLGIWEPRGK